MIKTVQIHAMNRFHWPRLAFTLALWAVFGPGPLQLAQAANLAAGVAKVDITSTAGPVNDPLFVKALVLRSDSTTAVIVTVDAVAIGEIGSIGNDYLGKVRARIEQELGIRPANVLVNASHCHGIVCSDVDDRTVQAVKEAAQNMVPVKVGVGVGHEDRIMENRRLKLKNGKEADVRHAYSLPPDEEVAEVGPIDPQIGILRLDRKDGRTLAVVYNFACHPIQGVPNGGNTADIIGFASRVIEDNLSDGTIALFVQGCGGDINPVLYKDVDHPRNAEPLGNMLGLSALRAVKKVQTKEDATLTVLNETLELPRADVAERIDAMEAEQVRLLQSLKGTSLNLKTFLPLVVKYNLSGGFPVVLFPPLPARRRDRPRRPQEARRGESQEHEAVHGEHPHHGAADPAADEPGLAAEASGDQCRCRRKPLEVEVVGLRIGDFVLVTFPGELTVQIGLNIKKTSPHKNVRGRLHQRLHLLHADGQAAAERRRRQEDSDCLLAPEWQKLFESKVLQMLKKL